VNQNITRERAEKVLLDLEKNMLKMEKTIAFMEKTARDSELTIRNNTQKVENSIIEQQALESDMEKLNTENNLLWLTVIVIIIISYYGRWKAKVKQKELEMKIMRVEDKLFNVIIAERNVDKSKMTK